MAKEISYKLIDDLDGSDAEGTVKFSLDGVRYEIDLSEENLAKFRDTFAPFTAAGTRVGRGGVVVGGGTGRSRGGETTDRKRNRAIREWATKDGRRISDRGRIPQEISSAYAAADH